MRKKNFKLGYCIGMGWYITCDVGNYRGMYYLHSHDKAWHWGTFKEVGGPYTGYWKSPLRLVRAFRKQYNADLKVVYVH